MLPCNVSRERHRFPVAFATLRGLSLMSPPCAARGGRRRPARPFFSFLLWFACRQAGVIQGELVVNCVCPRLLTHLYCRFSLSDVCRDFSLGNTRPPVCHSSHESFSVRSDVMRFAGEEWHLFSPGRMTTRS